MNQDDALQLHNLLTQGTTIAQVSEAWGKSRSQLYKLLYKHGLSLPSDQRLSQEEHMQLQQESGTPPEVYAYRAGISPATLRRYGWDMGLTPALNTHAAKKAWWERELDAFSPENAQVFCTLRNLPVLLVAEWYHKLNKPRALLLWGFNRLLRVEGEQFMDFQRFADPSTKLFALGAGKLVVPIGVRLADEIFKHAQHYQQS